MPEAVVRISCDTPGCTFTAAWRPERAGKRVVCKSCQRVMRIPLECPPPPKRTIETSPSIDYSIPPDADPRQNRTELAPSVDYSGVLNPPTAYNQKPDTGMNPAEFKLPDLAPPVPVSPPPSKPTLPPPASRPPSEPTPMGPPAMGSLELGPVVAQEYSPGDARPELSPAWGLGQAAVPTLDRRPILRRKARGYFTPIARWPYYCFSWAILIAAGGFWLMLAFYVAGGIAVVGLLGVFLSRRARLSDQQIDTLVSSDRHTTRQVALARVREVLANSQRGSGARVSAWEEPLFLEGAVFLTGADAPAPECQSREGADGQCRFARSNVMLVALGTHHVVTYLVVVNHTTGNAERDELREYWYRDLVTVEGETVSEILDEGIDAYLALTRNQPWGQFLKRFVGGPLGFLNPLGFLLKLLELFTQDYRRELVTQRFGLYSTGGTNSRVTLDVELLEDAEGNLGALARHDTPAETAIRNRIREIKSR